MNPNNFLRFSAALSLLVMPLLVVFVRAISKDGMTYVQDLRESYRSAWSAVITGRP